MRLHVLDAIRTPCEKKFTELLLNGFPEVKYSNTNGWKSYELMAYALTWARFLHLIDSAMKITVDSRLGVYTRKHSQAVIAFLNTFLENMTEQDVRNHPERFDTMFD